MLKLKKRYPEFYKNSFDNYMKLFKEMSFITIFILILALFTDISNIGNHRHFFILISLRIFSILTLLLIYYFSKNKNNFFKKHPYLLAYSGFYSVAISASVIGAFTGGIFSFYFFAIIELEVLFAILVVSESYIFMANIITANLIYLFSLLFFSSQKVNKDFKNLLVSFIIFIIISFFLHKESVKYKIKDFYQTLKLKNKKDILENELYIQNNELKKINLKLIEQNELMKKLQEKIFIAKEEEAKRIARELHDNIIQELSYLGIQLNLLKRKFNDNKLKNTGEFNEIIEFEKEIVTSVRNLSHSIHPSILDKIGLEEAVNKYILNYQNIFNIKIIVDLKSIDKNIQNKEKIVIYRIIQEAFTNAVKHSNATKLEIISEIENKTAIVKIKDNGIGITNKKKKFSLGLLSMKERINIINGKIEINSEINKGTEIILRINLN